MLILLTAWLVHNWWKLLIGLLALIAVIEYTYYYKKPGKEGSGNEGSENKEPAEEESDEEAPETEEPAEEEPGTDGSDTEQNT